MGSESVLDKLKRTKIHELAQKGERVDGRGLEEPRELSIETNVIPKADGSARVRLGDTEVVTGVKVQPDKPFPDMGDKGIFICTAEILPLAHPDVEPGPPNEEVIELARVVDRGIRESHMIDLSKLVLEKNKSVIGVFADNSVTDHHGNLFDACSYATTAGILSCKLPKWEMIDSIPVLVEGEKSEVPITTIPVSVTMGKVGDKIIVDPNAQEWMAMDARMTITTDSNGHICALQKGGSGGFTPEQAIKCGELSVSVGEKIRETLKQSKK